MSITEFRKVGKKGNKYNAKKTEYNGRVFDSKKEADFAKRLAWLRHAKKENERVTMVEYQVPLTIKVNQVHICRYICDFVIKYADKRVEYVDVKGYRTAIYKLKKRLVEAQYRIIILER